MLTGKGSSVLGAVRDIFPDVSFEDVSYDVTGEDYNEIRYEVDIDRDGSSLTGTAAREKIDGDPTLNRDRDGAVTVEIEEDTSD